MFTYIHDDEVKTIKTYTKNKQNSSTRRTVSLYRSRIGLEYLFVWCGYEYVWFIHMSRICVFYSV